MELYQIRHFVAVVEAGSFTRGAQRAAVSQPALSASIARLESELKVKLLNRDRAKVTPTASGQKLLAVATDILRGCASLRNDVKRAASPQVLRIGVLRTIASQKIARFLRAYRRANKDVAIKLIDGTREELSKALSGRRVAVVITGIDEDASKFASRVMFKEKYYLAAPVGHPLAEFGAIELKQLHGEPFIVRTSCETYMDTSRLLSTCGIRTRPVYMTDDDDRALALVEAGIGVALMPSPPDNDRIRRIAVVDFDVERAIGLRWAPDKDDRELAEFIEFAADYDWSSAVAQ